MKANLHIDAALAEPYLLETSPSYYISTNTALNIYPEDCVSGDWHPLGRTIPHDGQVLIEFAGDGQFASVNTNAYFGEYGIYDCRKYLAELVQKNGRPIYAANHIRAMADAYIKHGHYLADAQNQPMKVATFQLARVLGHADLIALKALLLTLPEAQKATPEFGIFTNHIDLILSGGDDY